MSSSTSQISLTEPLSYADRLRIRQPGDATFALGPHIDGGSVERWEPNGYGRGGVYNKVFEGNWEGYDPWDASGRVDAVNNLYDGLGACSMFRMWQGWLSMSKTGPNEGTLLVNPLMHRATAYVLLRPFFSPVNESRGPGFLDESNWKFTGVEGMTSDLQGASPGHGQELTDELHPHLELERTMVHMPKIKPGDFVAWHCDSKLKTASCNSVRNRHTDFYLFTFQQFTLWTRSIREHQTPVSCIFPYVPSHPSTPNTSPGSGKHSGTAPLVRTSLVEKARPGTPDAPPRRCSAVGPMARACVQWDWRSWSPVRRRCRDRKR